MGRKGAGPRLWTDELAPFPKILGATKDLGGESNGTGVCVGKGVLWRMEGRMDWQGQCGGQGLVSCHDVTQYKRPGTGFGAATYGMQRE